VHTPGGAQAGRRSASRSPMSQPQTNPGLRPPVPALPVHELHGRRSHYQGEGRVAPVFSEWLFHSYLELGPFPSAVPCARLHCKQVVWEWGLQSLADSTELIVSELMTNGIHASEGLTRSRYGGHWTPGVPPLRLWLHGQHSQVAIQVWDASDQSPTQQATDLDSESGRGLLLVESLSTVWGSYRLAASTGKIVWALARNGLSTSPGVPDL
jgi:hypothetical protein